MAEAVADIKEMLPALQLILVAAAVVPTITFHLVVAAMVVQVS